ncbi:hypothetical protein EVAR_13462_1 [Eumeta japonica]|uniref:Uncharacterized protein n=1 Tax=Eumeta variegata TaxID=151549 RepID=A0A4C1UXW5_EUMVA|nr:hypothetical protein EVAR_13462_1 [Eumeta japonica]
MPSKSPQSAENEVEESSHAEDRSPSPTNDAEHVHLDPDGECSHPPRKKARMNARAEGYNPRVDALVNQGDTTVSPINSRKEGVDSYGSQAQQTIVSSLGHSRRRSVLVCRNSCFHQKKSKGDNMIHLFISMAGKPRPVSRSVIGEWARTVLKETDIIASPGSFRTALASENWLERTRKVKTLLGISTSSRNISLAIIPQSFQNIGTDGFTGDELVLYQLVTFCDVVTVVNSPDFSYKASIQFICRRSTGNYWQRLPEIACQQYHQAAKDVVISPKILQCEVKCFK